MRELYNSYQKSLTNRERRGRGCRQEGNQKQQHRTAAAEKKRTMPLDMPNMDMSPSEMWNKVLLTVQGAVGDVEPTEALLALVVGYAFFKLVHLVVTSPSIPKSVWVPLEPGETTTVVEQNYCTAVQSGAVSPQLQLHAPQPLPSSCEAHTSRASLPWCVLSVGSIRVCLPCMYCSPHPIRQERAYHL